MIKRLVMGLILPSVLMACFDKTAEDGNPNQKAGVVNMEVSRLGMSGGFFDVNADGKIDFIAGAPHAKVNTKSGVALVYLDYKNNQAVNVDAFIPGEAGGDFFGFTFADVGDVNGDHIADFTVGAINAEGEAALSGAVYVYEGGSFPPKLIIKLKGENTFDKFGYAIAGADVNGDGESGAHSGSGFGYALAYAGDIDGDGFGDIAIGNKRRSSPSMYDNAGTLYVFKGGDNLPSEYFEDNLDYRLIKIVGAGFDEQFAQSITAVGDVDGGGRPDLVVGARWANSGVDGDDLLTGNVYLFYGEDLNVADASVDQSVELAHLSFSQATGSAELGSFVAVNGRDLVSGMPRSNKHNGGLLMTNLHEGSDVTVIGDVNNKAVTAPLQNIYPVLECDKR